MKNFLSASSEHGYTYIQRQGCQLGLTSQQVLVHNFGYHTITAIKQIKKRTKQLTSSQAFEMVMGKSAADTDEFVKNYLEHTKIPQKPISAMDLIRVIVNTGGGFGHQRAAITLMQKCRETGFRGVFDIQCDDRLGASIFDPKTRQMYTNQEPFVSRQLISMIPGFASIQPDEDGVRIVDGLGAIIISSLPDDYHRRDLQLPKADLAVCAAEDGPIQDQEKKAIQFNAGSYIGLEPTDWYQGCCFTTDSDAIVIMLPKATTMRLSSKAAYHLPDISCVQLSQTEQKIFAIIQDSSINSQLIYGLNPAMKYNIASGCMTASGWLDEAIEMQRIVETNLLLSQTTKKPSLLLLPQKIALDSSFIATVKARNEKIHVVDLTKIDLNLAEYKSEDLIIAYIGRLQQVFFDYLMLEGTTLPPVIEGCNSLEVCESAGRAFIHGAGIHNPLKRYEVDCVEQQNLHAQASLCLEQGNREHVPQLLQYMQQCLASDPELIAYHQQRREAFFKRPDAFEVALKSLGIAYQPKFHEASFFSAKQYKGSVQETQKGLSL